MIQSFIKYPPFFANPKKVMGVWDNTGNKKILYEIERRLDGPDYKSSNNVDNGSDKHTISSCNTSKTLIIATP